MTHRQRAVIALEGGQPDYVPTFELVFLMTKEAFGKEFAAGPQFDALPENDRFELCRKNAELYLEIARRYEHSIVMIGYVPSTIYPQRAQEFVQTMRYIREMAAEKGEDYMIIMHGDATFAIPDGDQVYEFSCQMYDDPAGVKRKAEQLINERIGYTLYCAAEGYDGFALCDDYAFNALPFLSPPRFAEFIAPYLKRIIAAYRGLGKIVIKHTDGNIMPIIDQLVECGPHALHSLDPQARVDIAEVKSKYGRRVALCGNVNCGLMQSGSESEVLESCEYAMRHGKPGGGYVFCTSNCVYPGMPLDRYDLMNRYWKKNRKY
jgi:uroporphyrinogen decarboxylase